MEVVITETAQDGQLAIYTYHLEYSGSYAEEMYYKIDSFIRDNLSEYLRLGHVYNK